MTAYTCKVCGTTRKAASGRSFIECLDCDGLAWAEGFGPEKFAATLLPKHRAALHNAPHCFRGDEQYAYIS